MLAVIDLPAAIALFERRGKTNVSPTDAATINRHKGQAAIRLASIDPAEAERLIAPPSANFFERPEVVLKVARKMANADLARARRLLETIDDESSPSLDVEPGARPVRARRDRRRAGARRIRPRPEGCWTRRSPASARLRSTAARVGARTSVANLMAELLAGRRAARPGTARRTDLARRGLAPRVRPGAEGPGARGDVRPGDAGRPLRPGDRRRDRRGRARATARRARRFDEMYGNVYPTIFKSLTAYDPRVIAPLLRSLPDAARRPPPKNVDWQPASIDSQIRLAAAQILGFPTRHEDERSRPDRRCHLALSPGRLTDDGDRPRRRIESTPAEERSMSSRLSLRRSLDRALASRSRTRSAIGSLARLTGLDRGRLARGAAGIASLPNSRGR